MPIVDDRNAKKVIVSEVNNDKDNSKLNKHENNISNGKKGGGYSILIFSKIF